MENANSKLCSYSYSPFDFYEIKFNPEGANLGRRSSFHMCKNTGIIKTMLLKEILKGICIFLPLHFIISVNLSSKLGTISVHKGQEHRLQKGCSS